MQANSWLMRFQQLIKKRTPWLLWDIQSIYQRWLPESSRQKLAAYSGLMRLDRPIGTYLLLWPTLWALLLASNGAPELHLLLVFTLGTFLMRSAGCVINDFADRDFDAHVNRTQNRPLAQKKVSPKEALILFAVLVFLAFLLVLSLNRLTIGLSFVAVAIAAIYPFMKRYTYFPQLILGAAFAWSIPMAYAAVNQEVANEAWLLYTATLLWVLAYDTFYGMVDRKDDLRIGIKSTAILFGESDLPIIALIQSFFMLGMLLIGARHELTWPYYLGWLVSAGLIGYQFWLARKRKPEGCFKAFLNNHYVGMALFIGMIGHFIMQ